MESQRPCKNEGIVHGPFQIVDFIKNSGTGRSARICCSSSLFVSWCFFFCCFGLLVLLTLYISRVRTLTKSKSKWNSGDRLLCVCDWRKIIKWQPNLLLNKINAQYICVRVLVRSGAGERWCFLAFDSQFRVLFAAVIWRELFDDFNAICSRFAWTRVEKKNNNSTGTTMSDANDLASSAIEKMSIGSRCTTSTAINIPPSKLNYKYGQILMEIFENRLFFYLFSSVRRFYEIFVENSENGLAIR